MPMITAHTGQLLLILVIVLLIFGASRLPALAKSLGQSARAFKSEMREMREMQTEQPADAQTPAATPAPQQATAAPDATTYPRTAS